MNGKLCECMDDVRMTVPYLYLLLAYLPTPIHDHPSIGPCYADWLRFVWPQSLNIWKRTKMEILSLTFTALYLWFQAQDVPVWKWQLHFICDCKESLGNL